MFTFKISPWNQLEKIPRVVLAPGLRDEQWSQCLILSATYEADQLILFLQQMRFNKNVKDRQV